jgi:hypothetical protein
MDEPSLMDSAQGNADADGELEESRCLHRFAEMLLEWLAARILEKQHRPITLANQFQRPSGPRTLEIVFESVFMREPFDACRRRGLCGQPQRQHVARRFPLVSRPSSAERAFAILPQHLETAIFETKIGRSVRTHLSRSAKAATAALGMFGDS